MAIKLTIDSGGNLRRHMEPGEVIQAGTDAGLFPLYTKQDLAERWGQSVQVINNWSRRHDDFPAEIAGILAQEPTKGRKGGAGGLFPAYAVRQYEENRGLEIDK